MTPQSYELTNLASISLVVFGIVLFVVFVNTTYTLCRWTYHGFRWFVHFISDKDDEETIPGNPSLTPGDPSLKPDTLAPSGVAPEQSVTCLQNNSLKSKEEWMLYIYHGCTEGITGLAPLSLLEVVYKDLSSIPGTMILRDDVLAPGGAAPQWSSTCVQNEEKSYFPTFHHSGHTEFSLVRVLCLGLTWGLGINTWHFNTWLNLYSDNPKDSVISNLGMVSFSSSQLARKPHWHPTAKTDVLHLGTETSMKWNQWSVMC